MSISIVPVVVPASGDGPIASIANLVGAKTVELSGTFTGRYVLLGSQNGANFVPVAFFDSDGKESIKVTLEAVEKQPEPNKKFLAQWRFALNCFFGATHKKGLIPDLKDGGPSAY